MAVLWAEYQPRLATGSGAFRESHVLGETWYVRTDSPPPTTSVAAILTAPGVGYGTAHPSFTSCKAMQWNYSPADKSGLLWAVTITYFVPIVDINPSTGLPLDVWSGRGVSVSQPFYKDKNGNLLTNSAGDPVEGMEFDKNFRGWTLIRCYPTLAAADAEMNDVNNRTNSDTAWPSFASYGLADTWKCSVENFQKKVTVTQSGVTQTAARYWEVSYSLEYNEGTWHNKPWDMGFNERVDSSGVPTSTGTSRRAILGIEGRPVKQAVALSGGVALPAGVPPVALDFDPYLKVSFAARFGDPS
jgi:hypothetical protein